MFRDQKQCSRVVPVGLGDLSWGRGSISISSEMRLGVVWNGVGRGQ